MMKKIKTKQGELTTQQIVMLIILIISFVVILFLLFRLNLGGVTDKEICHNSVVMKSKIKGFIGELDCKTNYVCIGDKCEGINPTETIKINMKKEDETVKQEIMKAIADEMTDCWWMFGEGEVKYGGAWLNYHCAICSIVKFDKKIQTKFNEITYKEFYDYLKDTKKDETQTYLIYLYDVFDVSSVKEMNEKIDFDNEVIFTNEKYAIVTGMKGIKEEYLHPYFVKSDVIKDKTECDVFDISKA